jgi:predicted dehydrogenase
VTGVQLANKKIGIIGFGNHASRVISILEKFNEFKIEKIFHPSKKLTDIRGTNQVKELYQCDCIFILSPNQTHYEYIFELVNNFDGYIFCEKPPVIERKDIDSLKKISINNQKRIFFNFNFRFSKIKEIIEKEIKEKRIGEIININIISTHGLAFKKEYKNSWRSSKIENKYSILYTVSIHYLDLIIYHFGNIEKYTHYPSIVSKNGTAYDTSSLCLKSNNLSATIFSSYAGPKINEIMIIGTNGYVVVRDGEEKVFSPRDTFDSKGFFVNPPQIYQEIINFDEEYEKSLNKSIKYFLNHIENEKSLDTDDFKKSISSTELLINIKTD